MESRKEIQMCLLERQKKQVIRDVRDETCFSFTSHLRAET